MTIYIHVFYDVHENVETYININLYNTEIFLYKPWRPKVFFQYGIIIYKCLGLSEC